MDKINIKLIEWFDDHFYKIEYTENDPCAACRGTGCKYIGEVMQDESCESCDGTGRIPRDVIDYFPSITTKLSVIAKPELVKWYGDIGNREAELRENESGDRGSRLHHAWQVYTQGGAVIFNDYKHPAYTSQEIVDLETKFPTVSILHTQEEMYQMMKLQKFLEAIHPKTTLSEAMIYDMEMREAGTMDNIFEIEKGEYLINGAKPVPLESGWYVFDLKTGNYIGEGRKQVAAYTKIVEKMGIYTPVGAIIGHTSSKNKQGIPGFGATVLNMEAVNEEYENYRATANLWEREKGKLTPKVFEIPSIIFKPIQEVANDSSERKG